MLRAGKKRSGGDVTTASLQWASEGDQKPLFWVCEEQTSRWTPFLVSMLLNNPSP